MFQSKSGASRVWDEIRKHHRYLILFSAEGESGDSVRMLTGVHLLTVQTMLMFVMALCYDVQVLNILPFVVCGAWVMLICATCSFRETQGCVQRTPQSRAVWKKSLFLTAILRCAAGSPKIRGAMNTPVNTCPQTFH